MKKPLIRFGLLKTEYQAEVKYRKAMEIEYTEKGPVEKIVELPEHIPGNCSDAKCTRVVKNGQLCFIDTTNPHGSLYCDSCGKCLRYERSKEAERAKKGQF